MSQWQHTADPPPRPLQVAFVAAEDEVEFDEHTGEMYDSPLLAVAHDLTQKLSPSMLSTMANAAALFWEGQVGEWVGGWRGRGGGGGV